MKNKYFYTIVLLSIIVVCSYYQSLGIRIKQILSYYNYYDIEFITPRKPQDYSGEKLLLCAGHNNPLHYWRMNNYKNNASFYSLDNWRGREPDYLADLTSDKSYNDLQKNKFKLVVDEYCPQKVSTIIKYNIYPIIAKNGMFLSKFHGDTKSIPVIKKELIDLGFKEVFIFDELDLYLIKRLSNKEILQYAKAYAYNHKLTKPKLYEFLAVK